MNDSQESTKQFKWSEGITLEDAYIKVGEALYDLAFDKSSLIASEDHYYLEESDKLAYYTEFEVWDYIMDNDEGDGQLPLHWTDDGRGNKSYLNLKDYKAYYDEGLGCFDEIDKASDAYKNLKDNVELFEVLRFLVNNEYFYQFNDIRKALFDWLYDNSNAVLIRDYHSVLHNLPEIWLLQKAAYDTEWYSRDETFVPPKDAEHKFFYHDSKIELRNKSYDISINENALDTMCKEIKRVVTIEKQKEGRKKAGGSKGGRPSLYDWNLILSIAVPIYKENPDKSYRSNGEIVREILKGKHSFEESNTPDDGQITKKVKSKIQELSSAKP